MNKNLLKASSIINGLWKFELFNRIISFLNFLVLNYLNNKKPFVEFTII